MSVTLRVHVGMMSTDLAWLNTSWSQIQGGSKHYQSSRGKGASDNRLLHCSQMSVKAKQVQDRAKKYSHEVSERGQVKKERKKKSVAFVTKVQIKKKAQETRLEKSVNPLDKTKKTGECEKSKYVLERLNSSCSSKDLCDPGVPNSSPMNTEVVHGELFPSNVEDNVEDLQGMIKCLTRRLREPSVELRRCHSVKPLASFARPTKGEISLSQKGPVVLAPVLMSQQGTRSRGEPCDKDSSKGKGNRMETKGIPQYGEPSFAHDNISVRGKCPVGHRKSRSAPERMILGYVDPQKYLCSCCRGTFLSKSDDSGNASVKRSQSASTERDRLSKETKRTSTGKLVKITRHVQSSVPSIPQAGINPRSNISPCRGKGILRLTSLTIDLDSLSSRDYGSPVPPPSPDQSDNECPY